MNDYKFIKFQKINKLTKFNLIVQHFSCTSKNSCIKSEGNIIIYNFIFSEFCQNTNSWNCFHKFLNIFDWYCDFYF